jgi:hypothetical protein
MFNSTTDFFLNFLQNIKAKPGKGTVVNILFNGEIKMFNSTTDFL